ncbi:MAG: site-specific integrase [Acidobacteria bacterium]|nr:site-specific integrase [Acidobacteriota bacterium]
MFKLADVEGHPHMFRDTFAVELLKHGVSLETVSMLLGHASIKVTEKHYKPWVKTLQDKLEADAMKGWPTKPLGKKGRDVGDRRTAGRRRRPF